MEEETKRELAEYKGRELRAKEDYLLSTEVKRDYDSTTTEEEINLRDYIDVLIRRKWILISCLVVSIITVAIASSLMKPIYKAEATIEIDPDNPKITTFQEVVEVQSQQTDAFYQTQYQLLKSRYLAEEVISALQLDPPANAEEGSGLISSIRSKISGLFSGKKKDVPDPKRIEIEHEARKEGFINLFLDNVTVDPQKNSRLVQVGFKDSDPELAAKVANTLADKYIQWVLERKVGTTKAAREFLERQLDQAKIRLEKAEEDLGGFAKSVDIVSLDKDYNLVFKQLSELNEALSKAETERLEKEALYKEVQSGNYEHLPQVMNDKSVQNLNDEYMKLKAQYDNMAVIYGPNYPDLKQLGAQIGRIQSDIKHLSDNIAESIKRDYQAALAKENILRQRAEGQKRLAAGLNEKTIQYRILEREVDTNKSIYENLLKRLKETEVASDIRTTNVQVVDYASTPLAPYKPNIKINMLFATLIGLMGGILLSFVFEHFDSTIKDEEEVKRRFPLPFLGAVPLADYDEIENLERIVYLNPQSLISEAYRVIRTSILYSSPDHPPKSLLVTSTQPLEGKTTTASNLALSMIQSGLRVALIDADLRKPRLHKVFLSNGNPFGLSTYLVGKMELPGVISRTDINNLDIIPSGPIPPNPAELLGSKKMKELIEKLLDEYDHVIVDGSPIAGFADSRLLSSHVDGVLIVTSVGITQRQALRSGIEEILKIRGRIIGAILNRLESGRSKYGYGYYYYYNDREEKKMNPGNVLIGGKRAGNGKNRRGRNPILFLLAKKVRVLGRGRDHSKR
ncbi:MAG: lipopolysaccharide biosynthesis protein [Candidatus Dadabacteria bacterium]